MTSSIDTLLAHQPQALRKILHQLGQVAVQIQQRLSALALLGLDHSNDTLNPQNEVQQKMDVIANDLLLEALLPHCATIGSEEMTGLVQGLGDYLLLIDPLDGSSNLDVNINVGTLFSIAENIPDPLQAGHSHLISGYFLYGSSTEWVLADEKSVYRLVFCPTTKKFYPVKCPTNLQKRKYYSVNEGYSPHFSPFIQRKIERYKKEGLSARYIGSLVADFHRNWLKGGVYLYPNTLQNPNGKLRLLYECVPLAKIWTKCGGTAKNEAGTDILAIKPSALHETSSILLE